MTDQIRITWYVKHQHTETFSPDEFAEWIAANRLGVDDPTNLDEVYEALDSGDWQADEALFDLARDRNWLESTEAEMADLRLENVPTIEATR